MARHPKAPKLPPDRPGVHWVSDENNYLRQQEFMRKLKRRMVVIIVGAAVLGGLLVARPWETDPSSPNTDKPSIIKLSNNPDGSFVLYVRLPPDKYGNPVSEVSLGGCRPNARCK